MELANVYENRENVVQVMELVEYHVTEKDATTTILMQAYASCQDIFAPAIS
jgi:hypothetical protein